LLIITVGSFIRGLDELHFALNSQESDRARFINTSCGEYALARMSKDINYAGQEIVVTKEGTCNIVGLLGASGEAPGGIIMTESTVGSYTSRAIIGLQSKSPVQVSFWREVAVFF